MWNTLKRNMEWLLIVALLVGAVMAVGCMGTTIDNTRANAGSDRYVVLGNATTLNGTNTGLGSASAPVSPLWYLVSAPVTPVSFTQGSHNTDSTIYELTFTPAALGIYKFKFSSNITGALSEDTVKVIVIPSTDVGPDQTVPVNTPVTVTGTSPVDSSHLVWWDCTSEPAGVDTSALHFTQNIATFTPTVVGIYTFSYIIGKNNEIEADYFFKDTVTITVEPTGNGGTNTPPIADAGPAQNAYVNTLVTLNGNISSDADGNPLTYAWTLTPPSGSNTTLTGSMPTFTPDQVGSYVASLIVNDGTVSSTSDTVTITVVASVPSNIAPVANAGPDQNATVGSLVNLSGGMSSDGNGSTLTYSWTLAKPNGSSAVLTNANTVNTTFIPDIADNYTATLIVNDGLDNSIADTVVISVAAAVPSNIAPVANAGPSQSVTNGTNVTLNGAISSDADGNTLTYAWSFSSKPSGSGAILTNANSVTPTFTPDLLGDYVISLVVNDGIVNSAAAITTVTSEAAPVPPPYGTIDTTSGLQNLLANNSFLNRHVTAASTLYEVFEFGPVGGSMTFSFINPYGAMLRRTGTWAVADAGFPQVTENAGPRTLNSAAPAHDESLLTMTGYSSNTYALTDGTVQTWLKVSPVTTSSFAGRRIEYNGGPPTPVYAFAADTINRTGSYTPSSGDTPLTFTWAIVNGQKAVLTFTDGSTSHLYLTVRGAIGSAVREMAIVNLNSSGTVTGGGLESWIWM